VVAKELRFSMVIFCELLRYCVSLRRIWLGEMKVRAATALLTLMTPANKPSVWGGREGELSGTKERKEGRRKRTCALKNNRRECLLSVGNRSEGVGRLEEALGESRGEVVPLTSTEEESESASYGRIFISTASSQKERGDGDEPW
jgi:hypothetical protein